MNKPELNQFIKEVGNLHKQKVLTDNEVEKLIRLATAKFIERSITEKINQCLNTEKGKSNKR